MIKLIKTLINILLPKTETIFIRRTKTKDFKKENSPYKEYWLKEKHGQKRSN
jgi:hypothetical protein